MSIYLTISFGKSNSANYSTAVKIATKLSSYKYDESKIEHIANADLNKLDESTNALKLIVLVHAWKSSQFEINGEVIDRYIISNILDCYISKLKLREAQKPHYCNSHLTGAIRTEGYVQWFGLQVGRNQICLPCKTLAQYQEGLNWWQFGEFVNGIWHLDKSEIIKQVEYLSRQYNCFHCPGYDKQQLMPAIDKLPDTIDASKSLEWSILEKDGKFLGVYPVYKDLENDYDDIREFSSNNSSSGKASFVNPQADNSIKFENIGGLSREINLLRELLEAPIKFPEIFDSIGIKPKKSALLTGPPGCGKTLIAKALASEIEANFIPVSGSEFKDKYVGETERKIRLLFETARSNTPSIIFIDEFDAIAYNRNFAQHEWEVGPIEQLLSLIDGFTELKGVGLICSTNRPNSIDPAITRPGRLDYILKISAPDINGRIEILKIHTIKMPLTDRNILNYLATKTEGFTGADLRGLCEEAAYNCIRRTMGPFSTWTKPDINNKLATMKVVLADFEKALLFIKPTTWEDNLHPREISLSALSD